MKCRFARKHQTVRKTQVKCGLDGGIRNSCQGCPHYKMRFMEWIRERFLKGESA